MAYARAQKTTGLLIIPPLVFGTTAAILTALLLTVIGMYLGFVEAPADFSAAPAHLLQALSGAFGGFGEPVLQGATWTTDAPFRETAAAIDAMTQRGLLAGGGSRHAVTSLATSRMKTGCPLPRIVTPASPGARATCRDVRMP